MWVVGADEEQAIVGEPLDLSDANTQFVRVCASLQHGRAAQH
jgi:hypothetical protein